MEKIHARQRLETGTVLMGTEIEEDFKFKRNGDVSYDQPKDEHFLLPVESGNKQKKPHSRREGEQGNDWEVDCGRDHFPFCIVWCPLPVLTWLLPFIGHLGIVTSEGIIHDFAGPYHVNVMLRFLDALDKCINEPFSEEPTKSCLWPSYQVL